MSALLIVRREDDFTPWYRGEGKWTSDEDDAHAMRAEEAIIVMQLLEGSGWDTSAKLAKSANEYGGG